MAEPFIDMVKTVDRVSEVMAQVTALTAKQLLVGVPSDKTPRKQTPITNASLAYIHEFGSPARNIPARPFLFPGVRKARNEVVQVLADGAKRAIEGESNAAEDALERAGIIARNYVVQEITDPEPPFEMIKNATIRARLRRTQAGRRQLREIRKNAAKQGMLMSTALSTWAAEGGNIHPLIDTGALRASITYVVR